MLIERLLICKEPPKFSFKLTDSHPIDLSSMKSEHSQLYKPYSSQPSAFKPFSKQGENNNLVNVAERQPFPPHNHFYIQPIPTFDMYINANVQYNDEAQIESFVSNLGKSKEGHVCLYCGKCYSRKYGLKIHIRTHTGYKPLKCKFCLRPFGDPSNLNKHIRLHAEGDTPYK